MYRLTRHVRRYLVLIPTLILAIAGPVSADPAWPTRPVRMIVPFPAGSSNHTAARVFAEGRARRWDKPVVVDNKPGGDASIGAGLFASARDDHTLLYGTSSIITVNPLVQSALPYDSAKDFVPISSGASAILVVAVNAGLPVRSLGELALLAKEKPGILNWGSGPSLPYYAFSGFLEAARARNGACSVQGHRSTASGPGRGVHSGSRAVASRCRRSRWCRHGQNHRHHERAACLVVGRRANGGRSGFPRTGAGRAFRALRLARHACVAARADFIGHACRDAGPLGAAAYRSERPKHSRQHAGRVRGGDRTAACSGA